MPPPPPVVTVVVCGWDRSKIRSYSFCVIMPASRMRWACSSWVLSIDAAVVVVTAVAYDCDWACANCPCKDASCCCKADVSTVATVWPCCTWSPTFTAYTTCPVKVGVIVALLRAVTLASLWICNGISLYVTSATDTVFVPHPAIASVIIITPRIAITEQKRFICILSLPIILIFINTLVYHKIS